MSFPSWPSLDPHLQDLVTCMHSEFATLPSPVTRAKQECWRSQALFQLSEADPPAYPLISEWLSEVLDVEVPFLDPEEAMRGFVEVHLLRWSHLDEELDQFSRALQARVLDAMFSSDAPVHRLQHSPLLDLTRAPEDRYLAPVDDDFFTDGQTVPGSADQLWDVISPVQSPPRKRRRAEPATSSSPPPGDDPLLLWQRFLEETDAQSGQSLTWGEELQGQPAIWSHFLQYCTNLLNDALTDVLGCSATEVGPALSLLHNSWYAGVVYVIRRLRRVTPQTYRAAPWLDLVKASLLLDALDSELTEWQTTGLAPAVLRWSDPRGLALWRAPHVVKLLRFHRVDIVLLVILSFWTPGAAALLSPEAPLPLLPYLPPYPASQRVRVIQSPKGLVRALRTTRDLVPYRSSPSAVFFLLSPINFSYAWDSWLLFSLHAKGYDTTPLCNSDGTVRSSVYSEVIQNLKNKARSERVDAKSPSARFQGVFADAQVEVILRRSTGYHVIKSGLESAKSGLLGIPGRTSFNRPCEWCISLKDHDLRCVRKVLVPTVPDDDGKQLLGCGVSEVPAEELRAPSTQKVSNSRGSKSDSGMPKPVYRPHNLGLDVLVCNEDIVKRCQVEIIHFVNEAGQVVDFLAFNAIPDHLLQRMLGHFDHFTEMKGLVRGKQFSEYSQGKMVPRGERTPSGGAPGDCHRLYDSMSADEERSLLGLFDNAEDSLIINEVTRIVAPDVFHEVLVEGEVGEPVGPDSLTMYYCKNYAAPLHFDNDVSTGLCLQLAMEVDGLAYSFVHYRRRKVFRSRSNSLWSFKGREAHGTVLPARRLRGGGDAVQRARVAHKAKPKKNADSAKRYRLVQRNREALGKHWGAL